MESRCNTAAGKPKGNELLLARKIRRAAIQLLEERAREAIASAAAASAQCLCRTSATCSECPLLICRSPCAFLRAFSSGAHAAGMSACSSGSTRVLALAAAEDSLKQVGDEEAAAALAQLEATPASLGAAAAPLGPAAGDVLAGAGVALPLPTVVAPPPLPTKAGRQFSLRLGPSCTKS